MSPLEIVIYSIMGAIVVGLAFKWFVWDIFIRPKNKKTKKEKKNQEQQEDAENEES